MVKRRRRKRRVRRRPEPRIRVQPSEAIEMRIAQEVTKAEGILRALTVESVLSSPYVVSAVVYHDGIFVEFNEKRADADPADRITAEIVRRFRPDTKRTVVALLDEACAGAGSEYGPSRLVMPVDCEPPSGSARHAHPYAIDLFLAEGSPVRSAVRGLVVLAERGWAAGDWFSTSSVRGGNTVIVWSPDRRSFFRYAHLERVDVAAGWFAEAGDVLGAVGHTGFNANRAGHGHHLHWEINEFGEGVTTPVVHEDLQALLVAASVRFPGSAQLVSRQTYPE